jgi:histidyl-tRNA synthetase
LSERWTWRAILLNFSLKRSCDQPGGGRTRHILSGVTTVEPIVSDEPSGGRPAAGQGYLPTAPYRGTRDFLPDEMSVRSQVFGTLHDCVERFGYQRYDGPLLESAEIYEAKSGQEIASQQLYSLTDRGGRRLAIRPEMTPSVARIIAGHAGELQFPVRWYCNVNCHRYERPQRGRTREHWQLNVDIFGSDSPNCELEMFELVHAMLASLGANRDMYELRVNDRVLLHSLLTDVVGVEAAQLRPVSAILDRWAKYPRPALLAAAMETGLSQQQFGRLEAALQSGEDLLAQLPPEVVQRSRLAAILGGADGASGAGGAGGRLLTFDPLIVRGFEYYTSTVFEVFDTDPQNARSLFGGGRYDDLTSLFSAQRIPGIGFAMGDVTLMDFLEAHGLRPAPASAADVVVLPVEEALHPAAREVASRLRAAGLRATVPLEPRKLGAELRRVAQAGAAVAVIIGSEEWERGELAVRDLRTREQLSVGQDQAPAAVTRMLAGAPA